MIDSVDLRIFGVDPSTWLDSSELTGRFAVKVNPRTGKPIDGVMKATYKSLVFEITPRADGTSSMTLRGSTHKYSNEGTHNSDQFHYHQLLTVIEELTAKFGLVPGQSVIEGIEVGVNLELPFPVKKVLTSVIAYKDKTFEIINARRPSLGRLCPFYEYDIKLYDKVIQSFTEYPAQPKPDAKNLLRYEVKVNKMRWLKSYGIQTLADLTEIDTVRSLLGALVGVLEKIVFVDIDATLDLLTDREQARYGLFRDRDKWRAFDKSQRYEMREQLPRLLKKSNAFDYGHALLNAINTTWLGLFQEAPKARLFHRVCIEGEADKNPTISPFKCLGETVGKEEKEPSYKNLSKTLKIRVCASCGKDISGQRSQSRFCSEKYNGHRHARHCRNQDSNQRKTKRYQVMRAQAKNQYVRITYHAINDEGNQFCDTLHSSEIAVSREWLDTVVRVEVLSEPPENLTDTEGRDYLERLTKCNMPQFRERMRSISSK
ncbi:hypothetical protein [Salmonirosea aquatica]|uniref:Uncharacterized protein n=1 Tax=Salmonirosea aquatica TaxID=2654236 RepID=A0A7C9BA19_9BACT|nr:hypothetical protein [Cytophagaceae bacterium SJW1-29]